MYLLALVFGMLGIFVVASALMMGRRRRNATTFPAGSGRYPMLSFRTMRKPV